LLLFFVADSKILHKVVDCNTVEIVNKNKM